MSTTLREEFEDWYENTFLPENLHLNDYINEDSVWSALKGAAWEAWQASRAKTKPKKPFVIWWELELCYKLWHRKSVTIMSLGQSEHAERGYAEKAAKEKGQKWLDENFKKEEVQNWEVRVRPAKKK